MTKPTAGLECRAILFDLDGVLVDSTASIERVWRRWARERGLDPDTVVGVAHGRPTAETIAEVARDLDPKTEVPVLAAAELEELDGTVASPGAPALLASLPGDQWAIVTSGINSIAEARLRYAGLPMPPVLITADMVGRGKPSPEGYLMAADRLAVTPGDCIVVEDSPPGILAAHAAGMRSIAVTTTHDRGSVQGAGEIIADLLQMRVRMTELGRIEITLTARAAGGNRDV